MLNLSEEAQNGLKKLKADLTSTINISKLQTKHSFKDFLKLIFGVSLCTIVLYCGLVMAVDYRLLLQNMLHIVVMLIVCVACFGALNGGK